MSITDNQIEEYNIEKPNFFIIGAPKCGTTALSSYLNEHPQVFFSRKKEPNYFNTDFSNKKRYYTELKNYLTGCFSGSKGYQAVGEGSVYYLYSKTAISNIKTFHAEAKFIVMLRNPIEAAPALHSTIYFEGDENVSDFERAWNLQAKRQAGKNIPGSCRDPKVLQYGEVYKYGKQLERLLAEIDRKNVLIVFLEDMKENPHQVWNIVQDFLKIDRVDKNDFQKINANKTYKYKFVHLFTLFLKKLTFIKKLKQQLKLDNKSGVYSFLKRVNTQTVERKGINKSLKLELINYFKEDITLVEKLTTRDLKHWYKYE